MLGRLGTSAYNKRMTDAPVATEPTISIPRELRIVHALIAADVVWQVITSAWPGARFYLGLPPHERSLSVFLIFTAVSAINLSRLSWRGRRWLTLVTIVSLLMAGQYLWALGTRDQAVVAGLSPVNIWAEVVLCCSLVGSGIVVLYCLWVSKPVRVAYFRVWTPRFFPRRRAALQPG